MRPPRPRRATGLALALAAAVATRAAAQQPGVPPDAGPSGAATVRDAGPGMPGRLLRDALARPHDVVVAPDTGLTLARDTVFGRTVLFVGGPIRLAATVHGDVVVLGDLHLRPGARVDGRAIAYGGGIYNSTLAAVAGGAHAYRHVTFDARATSDTRRVALWYRSLDLVPMRTVAFPAGVGVRVPTYDRIDGLALTFGPEIALRDGDARVEPLVTYRSHLGAVDPGIRALVALGRRTSVELRGERGTFTNDAWMREDLVNSAVTLATGGDARNYYRADRARALLERRFETASAEIVPFVGALVERAWSVGRDERAASAPYSVLGRDDRLEGMLRPNPDVARGTIASALVGARVRAEANGISLDAWARAETPAHSPGDARFTQLTADVGVAFTAFRDHSVLAMAHGVATVGDRAPAQRFAYLGGGPTLPSLPLLSLGGDRLLWTETRYTIPVHAVRLPFVGAPRVTFRHMIGSAGVGRLPAFTQNVGLRLGVGPLRLDYTLDPTGRGDRELGVGVGFR